MALSLPWGVTLSQSSVSNACGAHILTACRDAAQLQLIHSITTGAASVTFWLFAQLPQVIENYRNGS